MYCTINNLLFVFFSLMFYMFILSFTFWKFNQISNFVMSYLPHPQLSFNQKAINSSTWQAEQKKLGKEKMCICCTVSRAYGKRRETAPYDFHTRSKRGTVTLMGCGSKCKCCTIVFSLNVTQVHLHAQESIFLFFFFRSIRQACCGKETDREKKKGPGQCHSRLGQAVREIGATNCRLYSLRAETPVWSSGFYHIPGSRLCSVVSLKMHGGHSNNFYFYSETLFLPALFLPARPL